MRPRLRVLLVSLFQNVSRKGSPVRPRNEGGETLTGYGRNFASVVFIIIALSDCSSSRTSYARFETVQLRISGTWPLCRPRIHGIDFRITIWHNVVYAKSLVEPYDYWMNSTNLNLNRVILITPPHSV